MQMQMPGQKLFSKRNAAEYAQKELSAAKSETQQAGYRLDQAKKGLSAADKKAAHAKQSLKEFKDNKYKSLKKDVANAQDNAKQLKVASDTAKKSYDSRSIPSDSRSLGCQLTKANTVQRSRSS